MLIKQIIAFGFAGGLFFVVHVLLQLVIFIKNENLQGKPWSSFLFTAKILHVAMYLTFPTWAKELTKINPKMNDFKRIEDLGKRRIKQFNFF